MKGRISGFIMIGVLLFGVNLLAADGDLIVNGKVGIGTSNPSQKLDVAGAIRVSANSTETVMTPGLQQVGGDSLLWYATNLRIKTGATGASGNRVSILNNGNMSLGGTDPGPHKLYVSGIAVSTGGWYTISDLKFKYNVAPIESPLSKVLSLEGVSFNWKTEEFRGREFPEGRHYGVSAQKTEEVLPEAVRVGTDGERAVAYSEIIAVLIEAMKEQQRQIEALKLEVAGLKTTQ